MFNQLEMNKQFVEGIKTRGKGLLDDVHKMIIAIGLYCYMVGAVDNISTVKRTLAEENENQFLQLSCDTLWGTKWIHSFCDTMKGVRQADDVFVYFGAKPNKSLNPRSSTWPEVGKGTREGVGQRNAEKSVGELATERGSWQSTPDSRRDKSAWERVQHQWGKTSQDESVFLVALWKFREGCTSASVYRYTKECRVSQLNLLALELTQAHIVRLLFVLFSHSLDCISCGHREPLDDYRPRLKWFRRNWWIWGAEGI